MKANLVVTITVACNDEKNVGAIISEISESLGNINSSGIVTSVYCNSYPITPEEPTFK